MISSRLSKRHVGGKASPKPSGFFDDYDEKKEAKAGSGQCLKRSLFAFVIISVVLGALFFFSAETNSRLQQHTGYKFVHHSEAPKNDPNAAFHQSLLTDCEQKISKLEAQVAHPDCSETEAYVLSLKHEIEEQHEQLKALTRAEEQITQLQHKIDAQISQIGALEEERDRMKSTLELAQAELQAHSGSQPPPPPPPPPLPPGRESELKGKLERAQARIDDLELTETNLRTELARAQELANTHKETANTHQATIDSLAQERDMISTELQTARADVEFQANKRDEHKAEADAKAENDARELERARVELEAHKQELEQHLMIAGQHKQEATEHKATAERHKAEVEEHKAAVERYKIEAGLHRTNAEQYRKASDAHRRNADRLEQEAAQHKQEAEGHKMNAEHYKQAAADHSGIVERAKQEAEEHRINAERAKQEAEEHRSNAEHYKMESEAHRSNAERHQAELEQHRATAQRHKAEAEEHRMNAEHHKNTADLAKKALERLTDRPAEHVMAEQAMGVPITTNENVPKKDSDKDLTCDVTIMGSTQAVVNGCYSIRKRQTNGYPSYLNKDGKVLYWRTDHDGQWVIADDVQTRLRAYVEGEGPPGPPLATQWMVQQQDEKWIHETLHVQVAPPKGVVGEPVAEVQATPPKEAVAEAKVTEPVAEAKVVEPVVAEAKVAEPIVVKEEAVISHVDACGNGYLLTGAQLQTKLNGCYRPHEKHVNGFPSFKNKHERWMYWHSNHGGQWVVATGLGIGFEAWVTAPSGDTQPLGVQAWHTLDATGKGWAAETLSFGPSNMAGAGKAEESPPPAGCTNGMVLSGSIVQVELNGCFKLQDEKVNGFPAYKIDNGKIMYWQPDHGGQWVISDRVSYGYRAFASGQGSPGPHGVPPQQWHVSKDSKWENSALMIQAIA